ncbi:unnamed protein product [Eruca vesicaria subsp. sativa]|uniref:Uncharacterized protein n=1 Tax=Eruca vesicaria subsp. sativa TaxID=29727 RepID=A0ABC8LAW0_ERUVS|nr:unnamed protein product [Eruca vesicaria subsp. sativa]
MQRYRAMLLMYRDQSKAIEARHQEEVNKVRIEAKLEFLEEFLEECEEDERVRAGPCRSQASSCSDSAVLRSLRSDL